MKEAHQHVHANAASMPLQKVTLVLKQLPAHLA